MEFLIQELDSGNVRVTIRGSFDANTAPEVRKQLDGIVQGQPALVMVDISDLRQIDSTGVGGLVSLFKRVRGYGGEFRLQGVNGQPQGIFEVLRLDRVFSYA
jgi:anti-anti-sigma factor